MISGPDLGAGFLYQLSLDRGEDGTWFTYHAQEGGPDANGPPKGSPEPFGFVHPEQPCMFGGRGCWERRFELAANRVTSARQAYNRMRFVMAAQLAQAYDLEPPAFEPAFTEFIGRVADELERHHLRWRVGGSAGAWLRGAQLTPHDVDIGTTSEGVDVIGDRVPEYLIEPVASTWWSPSRRVYGARAFVGTLVSGCRVEWAAPLAKEPATGLLREWWLDPEAEPDERVEWNGHRIPVAPLEFALLRTFLHGDSARFAAVAQVAARTGVDQARLGSLANEEGVPTEQWAKLASALKDSP